MPPTTPPTIALVELRELLDDESEAGEALLLADDPEGSIVPVATKEAATERNEVEPGVDGPEIDEEEPTFNESKEDIVPLLDDFEDVADVLVLGPSGIELGELLLDESVFMLVGELFKTAEDEVELLEGGIEEEVEEDKVVVVV